LRGAQHEHDRSGRHCRGDTDQAEPCVEAAHVRTRSHAANAM
jgi:hypothetical protein